MLEKIKTPKDIQTLNIEQLQELAIEVRERILKVTAKNGGHVAPSLGATDLSIALLNVFDPLEDRVIWDVGHQSYAWKILTERNEQFDKLRQLDGISGFNNIFESKYDAFGVGHSSTSISAALGITAAKEIKNEKGRTIAIIGDGALTGGIAFEGLNNVGHLQKDMIVILNDNNMSISRNVGALQKYLADILVSRSYNAIKKKVWNLFHHFPKRFRRRMISGAQKFEENMINFFVPNVIFEDLGFKYVGPVDGHDIGRLIDILQKVNRNIIGPVLIHVVTKKGKGYDFAEGDASRFHGLGPYEIETGKCVAKKGHSYSKVFGDTLCSLAEKNDKIVAITAAMAGGTGLVEFSNRFPKRFFDVGIAEQHAVTFAGGLAVQGLKPFIAVYSTFLQRAFDQVIHDIALQKLPVVFCLDRAGLVGEDGATHHGVFDISYLNVVPGLIVMAPYNASELDKMMEFAAQYNEGPVVIRYPRGSALFCDKKLSPLKMGRFDIREEGKDITVIGIGKAYLDAEIIHEMLKKDHPNKNIGLVNARFSKPLDVGYLDKISNNADYVFTIEDGSLKGGFGQSVGSHLANSKTKVYNWGIPDKFITFGKTELLRERIGLTPEQIYKDIKNIIQ